jgi:hypothetical protein
MRLTAIFARYVTLSPNICTKLDAIAKCLPARPVGTTPIVAWHEVPGTESPEEPSCRVRYERAQLISEVFLAEKCAVFLKEG